jgi:hypothetical protein
MVDMDHDMEQDHFEENLLLQENPNFSSINPKYIKFLNCNGRFLPSIEFSDNESGQRVVSILCHTSDDGINFITSRQFLDSFFSFPYLFVIILRCSVVSDNILTRSWDRLNFAFGAAQEVPTRDNPARPLIISIESTSTSCRNYILYKNASEIYFRNVNWMSNSDQFFENLMYNLKTNLWGSFNDELLNTLINDHQSFTKLRIIDQALLSNNLLSIRFLQLFDPNLRTCNDNNIKPLEYAAQNCNVHGFLAIFGLAFRYTSDAYQDLMKHDIQNIFNEIYSEG